MSFGIKVYISVYNAPQTMNAVTLILHLVHFKVNDTVYHGLSSHKASYILKEIKL